METKTRDGLLLIDKQIGGTSHDVVQQARRLLDQKKIGHCGTLDPGATGLLLLTLGKATRLTRFLIRAPKVYGGTIRFGVTTDTFDALGSVTATEPIEDLSEPEVLAAMEKFVGSHEQTAPPYSAKKVKGRRYYELARRGEEVPQASKTVTIYEFAATGAIADGVLPFRLGCSSGTYVRTVAHDLGRKMGSGAHLEDLRRLRVGPFDVADAVTLEELASAEDDRGSWWIPFDEIPLPFGHLTADSQQEQRVSHGQAILVPHLEAAEGDWVKVLNGRRQLIAVGSVVERIGGTGATVVQPRIVFN